MQFWSHNLMIDAKRTKKNDLFYLASIVIQNVSKFSNYWNKLIKIKVLYILCLAATWHIHLEHHVFENEKGFVTNYIYAISSYINFDLSFLRNNKMQNI